MFRVCTFYNKRCEKVEPVTDYQIANANFVKSLSHYRNLQDQDIMEESKDDDDDYEKSELIEDIKKRKAEAAMNENPNPENDESNNNIFEVNAG